MPTPCKIESVEVVFVPGKERITYRYADGPEKVVSVREELRKEHRVLASDMKRAKSNIKSRIDKEIAIASKGMTNVEKARVAARLSDAKRVERLTNSEALSIAIRRDAKAAEKKVSALIERIREAI